MGELVLTNATVWLGGHDLSADANAVALAHEAEIIDRTRFGDTARTKLAGLLHGTFSLQGLWNGGADQVDAALFAKVGLAGHPITIAAEGGDDGELAFLSRVLIGQYQPGAAIGEAFAFEASGELDSGPLVRGTVMHNAARTTSGNGTARQLGALAAGQSMYASLHVIAASGTTPTLDVVIESDDGVGMASPATRITFTQATAIGGQFSSVAGAITDDYWRVTWTIGGGSPSFAFKVSLGIK